MFSLTVVDHLRLDSDQTAQNYTVHARAAERIVGVVFGCRILITALLSVATAASIAAVLFSVRSYQITAVVLNGLALFAFVLYAVMGLEARLFAHRSFAHRLWIVSERYRSLLTEVNEGTVDPVALVHRRDELIHDLHVIYEFGFGADQAAHEAARLPSLPDAQRAA